MTSQAVEFVGGPLDGHTQPFAHAPEQLPSMTGIPVNPTLLNFMFMDGEQDEVRGPATSIALYELREEHAVPRYRHLRSIAEQEHELQNAV